MLNRCPAYLPPLSMLLDDIGSPSSRQVAKTLGVELDQVRTWRELDDAPRPVCLSLYWLTRWGQSSVDCEAVNSAQLHIAIAKSVQRELDQVRLELVRLLAIADFGCANSPIFMVGSGPNSIVARPAGLAGAQSAIETIQTPAAGHLS